MPPTSIRRGRRNRSASSQGRVSQGRYWATFGVTMIGVPALLIGGIVAMAKGSFLLGLLMIATILPLGIYWRVTMMRRCRDIGWPAATPWVLFGVQMAMSFNMQLHHGVGAAAAGSTLAAVWLLGTVDFAF